MLAQAALFFITALLYAVAGFGGGSTYTALLVLAGTDYRVVPILSLTCNILVVAVGTWRFARAGHLDLKRAWPLFVTSVPAAWLGGRMAVAETVFVGLLAVALLAAAGLMFWQPIWEGRPDAPATIRSRWIEPVAGGGLGFLAGIVGIGGGIFLAPLLYLLRWGAPKAIAATCAAFILANSIAGLAGQAGKGLATTVDIVASYWPLFPAALIGGAIGSALGSGRLDQRILRVVTALLILYVGVKLAFRWWGAVHGVAG